MNSSTGLQSCVKDTSLGPDACMIATPGSNFLAPSHEENREMDKTRLILTRAIAGVKDFYISFEFEEENRWHEYSALL